MDVIWLIPILPGIGAAVNGLLGIRFFSKAQSAAVACGSMGLAAALSIYAFVQLLGSESRVHDVVVATWIPAIALETVDGIGAFAVDWAFRLDPLSGMMILVVSGIGLLIHIYSTSYMHGESDAGYARFFCYLNLFCFFMLTLVLGANLLVMFVGWEGVGLCSYLLIGFWYQKQSASDAGKKAFLVNRIGDWGFVLGIFLIFFTFGTLDFREVAAGAAAMPIETAEFGVISLICLFLFVGATGKSAQIPLYVWLPDAMEGPTPVSALIHAATMVTAGVYMVCRNAVLFTHAPMVMTIVAVIGGVTALMAASIGLTQTDIKRVLAYSTVSQLGYMFLATGVGAFAAGAFHLMTHAFFKALLFLGSGSVIHAMNDEQDMRHMGGLKTFMPVTFVTMLVGTLAIAGIPPLAGFFSKDEILFQTFLHNRVLWILAVATAGMTAFYMFRLMAMTFYGEYRGPAWEHGEGHDAGEDHSDHDGHGAWHGPHESPTAMTGPLMALAVGAIVAGFVGIPAALGGGNAIEHFLEPSFTVEATEEAGPVAEAAGEAEEVHEVSHAAELGLMALSILVALGGIALAHRLYIRRPELAEAWRARWAGAHRLLLNKYYVDELYQSTVVRGTMSGGRGLWRFDGRVVDGAVNGTGWLTLASSWCSQLFDRYVVDGAVNLVGWSASESSFSLRRIQTGLIQNYALVMLLGVFVFVSIYLLVR
ncbi:MAG: NADH-quinone oxidoreductase subunit L [Vicinamibacterales bacterium]|jgi:NADH-quinone oxidoreductase subunit L|nr:NADH-quinone oxidoreductase subunit L [Acidobacteriota bacterium]MDP6372405.1 NADH-quinone oxidoreductase subunit L [Vicinamibacterales bacterium]MDP6608972.1 NADH-quinone oxidoreductase subunit L [Vicinamibacterales bacterium]HAK54324.1 NADH-quinone oxidoreductase subunit L [Acidobacteriota bacterium]|tara:strand:- start:27837 stop:29954 length:2118 start_codon:yes stop_codon:yes gene_type:complete